VREGNPTEDILPFALPDIGEEEIREVVATLRSPWITSGPKVVAFERDFAEYIGSKHALAVNSATSGLHLALESAGIREGDLVITTPYTFTATAEVIRYLGADPVFVDVDPTTFLIDSDCLKDFCRRNCTFREGHIFHQVSGRRVSAVIPVHVAGLPCNMDAIESIAESNGLEIVEDAAHALPTFYKGRRIGAENNLCVFSFYATKPLTTGEGGIITTNDDRIVKRIRMMRSHGITHDVWDRYHSATPKWFYEVAAPGFKYNMPDVAAAIGIQQLKKVDRFHRRTEAFEDLEAIERPRTVPDTVHSWHLYIIRINVEARLGRDEFIEEMTRRGIGTSVHFIPLHIHPYYRDRYGFHPNDFPNALQAYRTAVSLPIFTRMTDSDILRVIEVVRAICQSCPGLGDE
jgi:dTDP-4-amino-4,6-dideoxygalactose transaminase